ncbi:YdbH family protein [Providencia sneebia]|uniref:Uncharacterized protein n=1 Tax=Providencia sneebia DSM 19967 TaxID=1141660 RepID=K8WAF7_9GAMM|nr:YdbH family protein [Providencia sneebia]EKT57534.1 hypothetical protein OO7_09125 [Providencia sneebia DSM 19967]
MKRILKILLLSAASIFVLMCILWLTMARWLPIVAKIYLPENVTLSISQPTLTNKQFTVDSIQLRAENCLWINAQNSRFSLFPLHLVIDELKEDNQCLAFLTSQNENESSAISVSEIIQNLPTFSFVINKVILAPWESYQGNLWLYRNDKTPLSLDYRGDKLAISTHITEDGHLIIERLVATLPNEEQQISLNGQLILPLMTNELPENGALFADFQLTQPSKSLHAKFQWQKNQGDLSLFDVNTGQEILHLPWEVQPTVINITNGRWWWEQNSLPIQGGISLKVEDWPEGMANMVISSRINAITEAKKGKANLVLTLPATKINVLDADIKLGLNGQVKYNDMVLDINLPTKISGQLISPSVMFQPGALLRAYGRVSPTLLLQEARLPLAGTSLNREGVSGRLQAILKVKEQYWGNFAVHLDGQADQFKFDKGSWDWKYWGEAYLPSLAANWDIQGKGRWQETLITLDSLDTGFDQIKYGLLSMNTTRLVLTKPLMWQRDINKAQFLGSVKLTSNRMQFGAASYLPKITINADIAGKSPADFQLKADLSTQQVGPIVIFTRWDGERFRGMARWPEQSVSAFQTLIPADLGITLREGKLFSQAAFSIDPEKGFIAGGHWRVENTGLWLKDGEISGLNFVLPWKLQNSTWVLGEKSPVELRIKQLNNLFELTDIRADLNGSYPPTNQQPLKLSNVSFNVLGGKVSLDLLRWPQEQPATIRLHQVELSQLFTVLKVSQFAASGKVDGELPFYLSNPEWIVKKGWVQNSGPLALRLDTQFVESIKKDNISAGSAISWLQYLEISRSRTEVNITNLGLLTMKTLIVGFNSQATKRQEVHLNYSHEENIFQLWKSLRFGSNLEEWLEKNL